MSLSELTPAPASAHPGIADKLTHPIPYHSCDNCYHFDNKNHQKPVSSRASGAIFRTGTWH